jgi:hypothetical protein
MSADPRYVAARRVLLDALEALRPHHPAVIVAGAQAIYLRTGSAAIGIAPYTTDGDLALDPSILASEPALDDAMRGAGFRLFEPRPDVQEPGIWVADAVIAGETVLIPVDLIVPTGAAPPGGRRATRLPAHCRAATRKLVGLEAALVDHDTRRIAALDPADSRAFDTEVAGVAALIVAKLHKLHDRLDERSGGRVREKDAADVYRLMQTSDIASVATRLRDLERHAIAGPPTIAAMGYLADLFGRRNSAGVDLAARALRFVVPEDEVRTVCVRFTARLAELRATEQPR